MKINTNGSSRGNLGFAGVGGLGRDNFGVVLFLFSRYYGIQYNNLMEALAILVALSKSCVLGWRIIICNLTHKL